MTTEDTKISEAVIRKRTENTKAKITRTMIYKPHRKLNLELHEPHGKSMCYQVFRKGKQFLVVTVVLLL
jgi:hypothetical protein